MKHLITPFEIKSKTVGGHYAKQTFNLINENGKPIVLAIRKRILCSNTCTFIGYNIIKTYKDKILIEKIFSIQYDTLKIAIGEINKRI